MEVLGGKYVLHKRLWLRRKLTQCRRGLGRAALSYQVCVLFVVVFLFPEKKEENRKESRGVVNYVQ